MEREERKPLAWHETLELHEIVALQSTGLMKLKMSIRKINDSELSELYKRCIRELETNLKELLRFFPSAQGYQAREEDELREDLSFYAADLLIFSKELVKCLAAAITETATPSLRKVLTDQLMDSIRSHDRVFRYMYEHGYYPAYDLGALLGQDMEIAQKAIKMRY